MDKDTASRGKKVCTDELASCAKSLRHLGVSRQDILDLVTAAMNEYDAPANAAADMRMAKALHAVDVGVALDEAMGECWTDAAMDELEKLMLLRFPGQAKSVKRIFEWAGDASNERWEFEHDCDNEGLAAGFDCSRFKRLFSQVDRAVRKLPWAK
jgi:hypothetical protein